MNRDLSPLRMFALGAKRIGIHRREFWILMNHARANLSFLKDEI
jgi:predicted DNA-binding protein (UPF0251 family)